MAWLGPGILRCLELVERPQRRGLHGMFEVEDAVDRGLIDLLMLLHATLSRAGSLSHKRQGRPISLTPALGSPLMVPAVDKMSHRPRAFSYTSRRESSGEEWRWRGWTSSFDVVYPNNSALHAGSRPGARLGEPTGPNQANQQD